VTTTRWMQSLVKTRPDLFRAIYDWNVYPHRWALPAWLEPIAVAAPIVALLERSSRGRQRLSRYFRHALGLHESTWDFQSPPQRLVLLSAASLQQLAHSCGATVNAGRLARIIAKDDRRTVIARVGEDAFLFALRRGRTFPGVRELESTVAIEDSLPDAIERIGWRLLLASVNNESPALRLRFQLKIPRHVASLVAADTTPPADASWKLVAAVAQEILTPEEKRCLG
jgi:hypothetical protein